MTADNSGGDINQTYAELNEEVCMFTHTHTHTYTHSHSINIFIYICTSLYKYTTAPEKLYGLQYKIWCKHY